MSNSITFNTNADLHCEMLGIIHPIKVNEDPHGVPNVVSMRNCLLHSRRNHAKTHS